MPGEDLYSKILVPVDGSEMAERAIPYAISLAKYFNSEVALFCVWTKEQPSKKLTWKYVNEQAGHLRSLGIEASASVTIGTPADAIVEFSEGSDINLIVMSAHGHGGVSRWPHGSVSNKVMHESYVPLLLIKPTSTNIEEGISWNTLVPLDGSPCAEASIQPAIGIANRTRGDIVLFRVNEAREIPSYIIPEVVPFWESHLDEAVRRTQEGIQQYLEGARQKVQANDLNVRCQTAIGRAAEEIIKYADLSEIGLIAISTHGCSGFSHWAFGSVARKVVESSSKPVLLFRTKPAILAANG